jgi:hypothetical protein
MVQYDPSIIQQMADALYTQAKGIEARYALLGLLLGGCSGYAGAAAADFGVPLILLIGGAVTGALLGFGIARPKAFLLRLQAQQALCQVKIEENTRGKG